MKVTKLIPVILCGGMGSRLWPLSRASFPKQYLKIHPQRLNTFFQGTINRLKNLKNINNPIIICNEEHRFIVAEQLRQIDIIPASIILEPIGRNTAPAITIACLKALENNEDPLILILPSDHIIKNNKVFEKTLNKAISYAKEGKIVTFGITPNKPETGFGYIESKKDLDNNLLNGEEILRFIEKPDKSTAKTFLTQKRFTWNSGMFLFKASIMLKEIEFHSNNIYKLCKESLLIKDHDLDFQRIDKTTFSKCKNVSIDKEIMEKTNLGIVLPLKAGWNDVGSWQSMWEIGEKDNDGNVIAGEVFIKDVENSYLRSEERLIAGMGLKNLIVVDTKDALLISHKDKTQYVKNIVQNLELNNKPEANTHKTIYRPWGNYTSIAEGENWQVKQITVKEGQSLSLQLHNHRAEHWIVVKGKALVEINGKEIILNKNESTFIPLGFKHRLSNKEKEPLILIEVQSGVYLGEDDIIRFEDNYGRL